MSLNSLPTELIARILDYLVPLYRDQNRRDLCQARLVCCLWNDLVTKALFKNLTLYHTLETAGQNFQSWNNLTSLETVRDAAQSVAIETCPAKDLVHGREPTTWHAWEGKGEWPAFTSAISKIVELDHISSISIRFSKWCLGDSIHFGSTRDRELKSTREHTLRNVLTALQKRRARHDTSDVTEIRELALENLQNIALPLPISEPLLKHISRLHIMFCVEHNRNAFAYDTHHIERVQYEPHLQKTLLPSVTNQLVELTLASQDRWGVMPGKFNGEGLVFPFLRTLTLGEYVIGHHRQFDWVLAQKMLTCLRLNRCFIASHMRLYEGDIEGWNIDTKDWERVSSEPYYGWDEHQVYLFDGRWETVFDNIRERLPRLAEFCLTWDKPTDFFRQLDVSKPSWLSPDRYITFDISKKPSPWIASKDFGYYPYRDDLDTTRPVNLAQVMDKEDRRAFEALVSATFISSYQSHSDALYNSFFPLVRSSRFTPACLNLEYDRFDVSEIFSEPDSYPAPRTRRINRERIIEAAQQFCPICTVLDEGMAAFWGDENWEAEEESEYSYDGIASDENGDDENYSDTDDYGPRQFLPDCSCDPTEALQDGESVLLLLLGKATLLKDLSICLAVKPVEDMQGAYRRVGIVLDDVDILERGGPASRFVLV